MTGLTLYAGDSWQGMLLTTLLLLHLYSIGLVVAGPWIMSLHEMVGAVRQDDRHTALAQQMSQALTINLSVGTVLGVGALLFMTVFLTDPFLVAATHLGYGLIAVIAILLFYGAMVYLSFFSWLRLRRRPFLHAGVGVLAGLAALLVPLVFGSIAVLMRHPGWWWRPLPALLILQQFNYWIRYAHFLGATVVVVGVLLILYGWLRGRRQTDPEIRAFYAWVRGIGTKWALAGAIAQVAVGGFLYLSLPADIRHALTVGATMTPILFLGALLLVAVGIILLLTALGSKKTMAAVSAFAVLSAVFALMIITRSHVRDAYFDRVRVPILPPGVTARE